MAADHRVLVAHGAPANVLAKERRAEAADNGHLAAQVFGPGVELSPRRVHHAHGVLHGHELLAPRLHVAFYDSGRAAAAPRRRGTGATGSTWWRRGPSARNFSWPPPTPRYREWPRQNFHPGRRRRRSCRRAWRGLYRRCHNRVPGAVRIRTRHATDRGTCRSLVPTRPWCDHLARCCVHVWARVPLPVDQCWRGGGESSLSRGWLRPRFDVG